MALPVFIRGSSRLKGKARLVLCVLLGTCTNIVNHSIAWDGITIDDYVRQTNCMHVVVILIVANEPILSFLLL